MASHFMTEFRRLPRPAVNFLLGLVQAILMSWTLCAVSWTAVTVLAPDMTWARNVPQAIFLITTITTALMGPFLGIAFVLVGWRFDVRLSLRIVLYSCGFAVPFLAAIEALWLRDTPLLWEATIILAVPTIVALVSAWRINRKRTNGG